MRRTLAVPALLACAALASCGDLTNPDDAEVLDHGVTQAGPLTRTLTVEYDAPAPLTVRYAAADGPTLESAAPAAATHHSLTLARLRPGRAYTYRIDGSDAEGTFTTNTLPDDLADVGFDATGAPTVPLVAVHLFHADGFHGYAIVDGAGTVVWYWRTVDFTFGMDRRANGNFVFMDKGRGLVEVTPAGEAVHELVQDTVEREMHHDAITTPEGTVLFLAFDDRPWNDRRLKGEAIWEWMPETGEAVKRWSSWDAFTPEEDRGPRFGREWMHANSLAIGPRGNVVVSVRYWNQVISIAPGWGPVEWRLNGVNATHSPDDPFSGQHTAVELPGERVIMFDNRTEREDYSRAVEYQLREGSAQVVWSWSAPDRIYSFAVSGARRLEGGNTLVAFGLRSTGPTEVYEVTPDGDTAWRLVVDGVEVMYRAEPIATIAGERVVDDEASR